jgi:hypothetical protein
MVYFISGHRNITQENFDKYYINKINKVIISDNNATFVIGDYWGVDIMAQEYLVAIGKADLVTVYHMLDKPRNIADGITKTVGGFKSNEERDAAMTKASDFDILVYDHSPSGTEQNLLRRHCLFFEPTDCS